MTTVAADPARRRIRLPPAPFAAVVLLVAGPLPPRIGRAVQTELAALDRAGVLRKGALVGWLADLVAPVVAADVRSTVEQLHAGRRSVTELWLGRRGGTIGEVDGDGTTTLSGIEPSRLASTLADVVGIGPRPSPIVAGLRVDLARLAEFDRLVAGGDPAAATRSLTASPTGRSVAALAGVIALATNERRAWRVTVASTDPSGGAVVRSLAVVDAGPGGLWRAEPADDGAPPRPGTAGRAPVPPAEPAAAGGRAADAAGTGAAARATSPEPSVLVAITSDEVLVALGTLVPPAPSSPR